MATLMLVLMVPVSMDVFVAVDTGLVLVLMPVMAVGTRLVAMFVLMFVLVVAAHLEITSFWRLFFNGKYLFHWGQGEFSPLRQ
jgi:hypothetical protein